MISVPAIPKFQDIESIQNALKINDPQSKILSVIGALGIEVAEKWQDPKYLDIANKFNSTRATMGYYSDFLSLNSDYFDRRLQEISYKYHSEVKKAVD